MQENSPDERTLVVVPMSDLIAQAQAAAQQDDWATVVHWLQQSLNTSDQSVGSIELDSLLGLALQVLRAGDFQEQWDVAKMFSAFGDRAIEPLSQLLQDEEAELESRWFTARILGDLNNPIAIRVLVEQLQSSEDEDLGKMAAGALANLGSPAIAALTVLLTQADTRLFAIQSLAQIRKSETITPLLSVVTDSQPAVRATAIDALSSFHDPRIPPVLLDAVRDPAAIVRRAAIAGLGVRDDLTDDLNLVNVLSECLWDLNPSVCQQATLALGRLRNDVAIPAFNRAFRSSPSLQLEIIRAIGWIGTQAALAALQDLIQEVGLPLAVYQEIVTTLGRWADPNLRPEATQSLIAALESASTDAATSRPAIASALGELRQPCALEPLIQLLADDDSSTQLHAIAALKNLGTIALARLNELQTNPDLPENLRLGVAIALREW